MSLAPGTRIGSYEIASRIGAGGMGEVYRARDLKLGREAALKVLTEELAADPERLRRFEQEARAASALNHPSIVTIYDIDEHESTHYIAMELVEGMTLTELIRRRDMPLERALACAIQIADGLARAHEKGIVHRDLKPDNVMLTGDGRVKILDFGLAKLVEPGISREAPTLEMGRPQTREHHVVGTVPYMSPEQAEGKPVDARSDIFSFGSLLYEMVTGRRAFRADSTAGLFAAVLHEDPGRTSDVVPSVPLDLDKLVARALRKDPGRRFQSMADVRLQLLDIKEELDSGSFVSAAELLAARPERRRRRWLPVVATACLAAGLGVAAWLVWGRAEDTHPPPTTRPLTAYPGWEGIPTISPDGSYVAYLRMAEPGVLGLYVTLVDGGQPLLLARDAGVADGLAWSPSGRELAFLRDLEGEDGAASRGVFVVPVLGGTERQIAVSRAILQGGLAWSPDGTLLALTDRERAEEPDGLFLLTLETGETRRLTRPPSDSLGDALPRFSPDGRTVAFRRESKPFQPGIHIVSLDGGEPRRVTSESGGILPGLDWTPDGRDIVFSSNRPGRVGYWSLWRVSVAGGAPQPLEMGEEGGYLTVSREGHRMAYERRIGRGGIYRARGPGGRAEDGPPGLVIATSQFCNYPQYSPDGRQILATCHRAGYSELWIHDSDGANPRQLTFLEGPAPSGGSWSPDGRQIAFLAEFEGHQRVHVVSAGGGIPRRLTSSAHREGVPAWSRDGRFLYFSSDETGRRELYRAPAEGGDAVRLTKHGGTEAHESHDGGFLYFTKSLFDEGPPGIWRIPVDGGGEERVHDRGRFGQWDLVEDGICYLSISPGPSPSGVERLELATGEVQTITTLDVVPSNLGFSVSPDGRWVLFQVIEWEFDIMLVEDFR